MAVDTIYALATPPGRSGVAVVRVSGPAALAGLCRLSGRPESAFAPRQAVLCRLTDHVSRETIDKALTFYFAAPASFTGEDVVEYHVHGGQAVIQALLSALSAMDGYRMADPGEFTRRAFENNKMDLTEAEAIADLIDAETVAQKNQALDQLGGVLSRLYDDWRERLTKSLAYLEADIDFADDDMPDGVSSQVLPVLQDLRAQIADHLSDNRRGERLRDGIQIAVIGAPNAGKSSLVNALAQRDVAIVSEHAGTTRDVIEVHLDLGGYPVILADTAGLRPDQLGSDSGHDLIESEGIKRALDRAQNADLRLLLFDASAYPDLDAHTAALVNDNAVIALNKTDALHADQADRAALCKKVGAQFDGRDVCALSVNTGDGIKELLGVMEDRIATMIGAREMPSLTRRRHREALEECAVSLDRALAGDMPELIAEDVRLAVRALGRITGRVDVEDLLDVIFRDFCLGK